MKLTYIKTKPFFQQFCGVDLFTIKAVGKIVCLPITGCRADPIQGGCSPDAPYRSQLLPFPVAHPAAEVNVLKLKSERAIPLPQAFLAS